MPTCFSSAYPLLNIETADVMKNGETELKGNSETDLRVIEGRC